MNQIKFYQHIGEIECLQGDTSDIFHIPVIGLDSLDGCSMTCIFSEISVPEAVAFSKDCTLTDEGDSFEIQFTSDELSALSGTFRMHFRLTDSNGFQYRKLTGTIKIIQTAQGA